MAGPDDPHDDPPADEPPADAPPADELRARDIAASKSTADLEERLDPQTIAQLASWFGLPSFAELEERQQPPPEDPFFKERREINERIAQDADPRFLALLDRHIGQGDALLKVPPFEGPKYVDIRRMDETFVQGFGDAAEEREFQRPDWIDDVMHENAPQAILRDLHRPEDDFTLGYELPPPEPGMQEQVREIREIVTADYKVRPVAHDMSAVARESLALLHEAKRWSWEKLGFGKSEDQS